MRNLSPAAMALLICLLALGTRPAPAQEQTVAEIKTRAHVEAMQLAKLRRQYARAVHALSEAQVAAAIEENRLSPGRVSPTAMRRMVAVVETSRISAQMAELMTHPTEIEKDALRLTLDQKVSAEFRDISLEKFAEALADKYKINVLLDRKALDDAGIGSDTKLMSPLVLRDVPLRSLLTIALEEIDLTFLANDGVLLITSQAEADQRLTTVIYDVYDLLVWDQLDHGSAPGNPDYDSLIELITSTVSLTTWDEVGGPGSIAGLYGALTISQTQEVHRQISDLLLRMRKMRLSRSEDSGVKRLLEAVQ